MTNHSIYRAEVTGIAESKLNAKMDNGEDWAIKFVLGSTNRGRMRGYGDAIEQNVNLKGEGIKLIIHEKNEK